MEGLQQLPTLRNPINAAFSARMRIVSNTAFAAEKTNANQGKPRHNGKTAISPMTTK
jgi:hypothetical protein